MKEYILTKFNEILSELEKVSGVKESWEDFLMVLAKYEEGVKESELQKSIQNLVEIIPFEKIVDGIEYLAKIVKNFPTAYIYKQICCVQNQYLKEKNNYLTELKNILSELATPTIRIWKDVVLLPLIGTLDSERAQSMSEKLLEFISETRAKIAIIDVTGVPIIDTVVGGYLIEMFNAVKLMGCDVILTGIKPNIAHTLVKIGIDFNMVIVKRDLESGLKYAISEIEEK